MAILPKSDYLVIVGILMLVVSTFFPWYHWTVDASNLSQKLSRIDPTEAAKVGLTSTDTQDVLSTYGDIGPDAVNDNVNFWGLFGSDSVRTAAGVFLIAVVAAGTAVLFSVFSAEERSSAEDGFRISSASLSIFMVLIIALALALLLFSLGNAAGDWSARHPAKDATTAQWRQDSLGLNPPYYQIVSGPGYGRWIAAGAIILLLAGVGVKLRRVFGTRRSVVVAASST